MKPIQVSVRHLVEFVLRRGSINAGKNSNHTALEGARIHRKLQKEAGEGYQKEVTLKHELTIENFTVKVEGRADGLFFEDGMPIIDEIKTSETAFEQLDSDTLEMFFYQGMVYAYIYGLQNKEQELAVEVTYFQTIEEIVTKRRRQFTFSELETFFSELMAQYHKWLEFQQNWRILRNASLKALLFPYGSYRKGQRELAAAVYKTIVNKKKLFAEAPTGTGKTISTLFPALKAVGQEQGERLFYLTAKTITRGVAEDALAVLEDSGAQVKSVTITAKDKICFLEKRNCTPEHCPYADGYYNRINDTLWDLLNHENRITRTVIERYAKKHTVCPFELSLDVSLWCDVVVGDYNYLFDPTVYLRRFFEEENEDNLFLVDEAHNLVNRSKEMYSATIAKSQGLQLYQALGKEHKKLRRALKQVEKEFTAIETLASEDGWDYHHQKAPAESLTEALYRLAEKISEWLTDHPDDPVQETVLSYYFEVRNFLKMSEFYDDHYETIIERTYRDLKVRAFCIDPSDFLAQTLEKGRSSVLFSASFSPLTYYQEVLGGKDSLACRLPSPFDPKKQLVLIDRRIDTTYKNRDQSVSLIVEAIKGLIAGKMGNYLVFFPSYQYLDQVAFAFQKAYPAVRTLIQDSHLNEEERQAFLAEFKKEPAESLVGFCVLGGVFSEGIDLKGSRLVGSVIVSVGLPQLNHEQELIKAYFDEKNHQGFAYAYQLPGMNKVIQAGGRVIRDEEDRGIILLLDRRFTTASYRNLLPLHWQQHAEFTTSATQITEKVGNFWASAE